MLSLNIGDPPGMNGYAFWATIVQTLVWPVAISFIAWIFRDRVSDVLSRVLEVTFPGGAVKFADKLADIKATGEEVVSEVEAEFREVNDEDDNAAEEHLDVVYTTSYVPEAVILDSFRRVELAIKMAAQEFLTEFDKPLFAISQELLRREIINTSLYVYFQQLRDLRNQVAHTNISKITRKQAEEYANQTNIFLSTLRKSVRAYRDRHHQTNP